MKRFLILLALLILSCNKLPVGEEELGSRGDFNAQYIELAPYITLTEYKNIPLGLSSNLICGKNSEYESRILLKFSFPDTIESGLDEIKLVLRRNTKFNFGKIKFSFHLLDHDFDEAKANWTKRTENVLWTTAGGDFEGDSLRSGQFDGDSLVVFFNYLELERIRLSDGLIMVPEDTGFVVFYSKEGGVSPRFVLVKNEASQTISVNQDCHILIGPEPFYTESWIGSGMAFRNYVKFVYDTLFDEEKAIYASLTFRPAAWFALSDTIEIAVKELVEPFADFNTSTGPLIALQKFAVEDSLCDIDIVKHIQHVIDHPDSNFGIFVYISPDNYDISHLRIMANSHHLRIGYIKPPEER